MTIYHVGEGQEKTLLELRAGTLLKSGDVVYIHGTTTYEKIDPIYSKKPIIIVEKEK